MLRSDEESMGGVEFPASPNIRDQQKKTFPWFTDDNLYLEYKSTKRADLNVCNVIPLLLTCLGVIATRLPATSQSVNSDFGVCFIIENVMIYVAFLFLLAFYYAYTVKFYFYRDEYSHRRFVQLSSWILKSQLGDYLEDVIAITAMGGVISGMFGRVWHGQCAPHTSIWDTQNCNPVASSNSIPVDHVLILYLVPNIAQSILKTLSLCTMVAMWMASVITVMICVAHVNGWYEAWTIGYSIFFLYICLANERFMRLSFLTTKAVVAADDRDRHNFIVQQKADRELLQEKNRARVAELALETERARRESQQLEEEAQQIRGLIGNVAHDLRTPLQTFRMDLETMATLLSKMRINVMGKGMEEYEIYSQLGQSAHGQLQQDKPLSVSVLVESANIIDSLNSACNFMSMAINRGLDFTKASNGIALVPILSSFDINQTISDTIWCVQNVQPNAQFLIFGPTSMPSSPSTSSNETTISHIISDKLWFEENILCFLSNAVKYGNGQAVEIYLEIYESDVYENNNKNNNNTCNDKSNGCKISNLEYNMDDNTDDEMSASHNSTDPKKGDLLKAASFIFTDLKKGDGVKMLKVTVEDHGAGIADEERQSIFQPFKQSQRVQMGGAGLGLFSVAKRLEALNGRCGVDKRRDGGSGSAFWISFPYIPDSSHVPIKKSGRGNLRVHASGQARILQNMDKNLLLSLGLHTDSPKSTGSSGNISDSDLIKDQFLRVLVVDDSPSILKVTSRSLLQYGHSVETASNGLIGCDLLCERLGTPTSFDVVLMDLQMPIMGGIEAIQKFREFESQTFHSKYISTVGSSSRSVITLEDSDDSNNNNNDNITNNFKHKDEVTITITSKDDIFSLADNRCKSNNNKDTTVLDISNNLVLKRVKIIAMSANSDSLSRQAALDAGADCFISKPFTYKDVEPFLLVSEQQ